MLRPERDAWKGRAQLALNILILVLRLPIVIHKQDMTSTSMIYQVFSVTNNNLTNADELHSEQCIS